MYMINAFFGGGLEYILPMLCNAHYIPNMIIYEYTFVCVFHICLQTSYSMQLFGPFSTKIIDLYLINFHTIPSYLTWNVRLPFWSEITVQVWTHRAKNYEPHSFPRYVNTYGEKRDPVRFCAMINSVVFEAMLTLNPPPAKLH